MTQGERIGHVDAINCLTQQIDALLDLMMASNDLVDMASIRQVSEMILSMMDELTEEVKAIEEGFHEE